MASEHHTPTEYVWLTVTHIHTLHTHTSQSVPLPGSGHALTSFGSLPFTQGVLTALRLNKHRHTHASDLWSSKFLLDNEKWESHTQICCLKLKKSTLSAAETFVQAHSCSDLSWLSCTCTHGIMHTQIHTHTHSRGHNFTAVLKPASLSGRVQIDFTQGLHTVYIY